MGTNSFKDNLVYWIIHWGLTMALYIPFFLAIRYFVADSIDLHLMYSRASVFAMTGTFLLVIALAVYDTVIKAPSRN